MTNKNWFDAEMAAEYLGVSRQEFYALIRNNEARLNKYLSHADRKMMIHREGLNLLLP
jgi:hypothetical protein